MKTWRMMLVIAALLATGCSSAGQRPAVKSTADGTSETPVASPQPVKNPGQSTPDVVQCGQDENKHGIGRDMEVRACFWNAYQAGKAAEFSTVAYTTEGDPISYKVKVLATDRIDVSVDSKDKFGKQGQFEYTCTSMQKVVPLRADTPDLQTQYGFKLVGCSGSEVPEVSIP